MYTKIIQQLGLGHMPVIGTGYFSIILQNGEKVIKLTTCDATYQLFDSSAAQSKFFPTIYGRYGVVACLEEHPVFRVDMQRLYPVVGRNLLLAQQIRQLYRACLLKINADTLLSPITYQHALFLLSTHSEFIYRYPEISEVFKHLFEFVKSYECLPDLLNPNNYLQTIDGQLVFSDPVAAIRLFNDNSLHGVWKMEMLFGSHWKKV